MRVSQQARLEHMFSQGMGPRMQGSFLTAVGRGCVSVLGGRARSLGRKVPVLRPCKSHQPPAKVAQCPADVQDEVKTRKEGPDP